MESIWGCHFSRIVMFFLVKELETLHTTEFKFLLLLSGPANKHLLLHCCEFLTCPLNPQLTCFFILAVLPPFCFLHRSKVKLDIFQNIILDKSNIFVQVTNSMFGASRKKFVEGVDSDYHDENMYYSQSSMFPHRSEKDVS